MVAAISHLLSLKSSLVLSQGLVYSISNYVLGHIKYIQNSIFIYSVNMWKCNLNN